jgi:hypothetical protein
MDLWERSISDPYIPKPLDRPRLKRAQRNVIKVIIGGVWDARELHCEVISWYSTVSVALSLSA